MKWLFSSKGAALGSVISAVLFVLQILVLVFLSTTPANVTLGIINLFTFAMSGISLFLSSRQMK